jgi:hypothetical protein
MDMEGWVMLKKIWLLCIVAMAAMLLIGSAAWADGEFYVIAAGPTAVGTKITSVPYEIKNPGFYYLTGNLNYSGSGNAITVSANNVTLDLMGFTLTGISGGGYCINLTTTNNVEIRNGTISNFISGWAIYGFGANNRVSRIRALNNGGGFWLGTNVLIEGCNCSSNGLRGIQISSGTVSGCTAVNNQDHGIQITGPGVIIGNVANNNTNAGFWLSVVSKSIIMVDRNSASGNGTPYDYGTNTNIAWGVNGGH